jgi:hypothetical protein
VTSDNRHVLVWSSSSAEKWEVPILQGQLCRQTIFFQKKGFMTWTQHYNCLIDSFFFSLARQIFDLFSNNMQIQSLDCKMLPGSVSQASLVIWPHICSWWISPVDLATKKAAALRRASKVLARMVLLHPIACPYLIEQQLCFGSCGLLWSVGKTKVEEFRRTIY